MTDTDWPIPKYVTRARAVKNWRKERFAPVSSWILKSKPNVHRKPAPGEALDPEEYEVSEGAWDHEHCMLCMTKISMLPGDQAEGFTDGKEWLCLECHERYVAPSQGSI